MSDVRRVSRTLFLLNINAKNRNEEGKLYFYAQLSQASRAICAKKTKVNVKIPTFWQQRTRLSVYRWHVRESWPVYHVLGGGGGEGATKCLLVLEDPTTGGWKGQKACDRNLCDAFM